MSKAADDASCPAKQRTGGDEAGDYPAPRSVVSQRRVPRRHNRSEAYWRSRQRLNRPGDIKQPTNIADTAIVGLPEDKMEGAQKLM